MGEYTLGVLISMVVVVVLDLFVVRTRLMLTAQYWLAMGICLGFQVLVDGWLTRFPAPLVRYNPEEFSGVRFPWHIPIEDFGFGFAMLTLALIVWRLTGRREGSSHQGAE